MFSDYSNDKLGELQHDNNLDYNGRKDLNREIDKRKKQKQEWKRELQEIDVPTEQELAKQRYWDNVKYEQEQQQFKDLMKDNNTQHIDEGPQEETEPFKSKLRPYVDALREQNYRRRDLEFAGKPRGGHHMIPNDDTFDETETGNDATMTDRSDNNKEVKALISDNYIVFMLVLLFIDYFLNLGVCFVFMYGTQYGIAHSCDRDLQTGIYYVHWILVFVLSTVGFLFGLIFISLAKCKQIYIWQFLLIKILLQDIGCTSVIVNAYYYGSRNVDIISILSVTMAMINVIFCFIIPSIINIRHQRANGKEDHSYLGICGVCCCSAAMIAVFIMVYMITFEIHSVESYETIYSYTVDGECAGVFDTGDHRIRQEIKVGAQHWLQCAEFDGINYCIMSDNAALEIWSVKSYAQSCLEFTVSFGSLNESLSPVCTDTHICFDEGVRSLCVTKAETNIPSF